MENEEKLDVDFPDIPDPEPDEPRQPGDLAQTAAVQAVVCCLIAAALLILCGLQPETGSAVFARLRELATCGRELIPDLVEYLTGLCGR